MGELRRISGHSGERTFVGKGAVDAEDEREIGKFFQKFETARRIVDIFDCFKLAAVKQKFIQTGSKT